MTIAQAIGFVLIVLGILLVLPQSSAPSRMVRLKNAGDREMAFVVDDNKVTVSPGLSMDVNIVHPVTTWTFR